MITFKVFVAVAVLLMFIGAFVTTRNWIASIVLAFYSLLLCIGVKLLTDHFWS